MSIHMSDSETESLAYLSRVMAIRDLGKRAVVLREQRNHAYAVIQQLGGNATCRALHPNGVPCTRAPGHSLATGHHSYMVGRWSDHLIGSTPSPWTEAMIELYYEVMEHG